MEQGDIDMAEGVMMMMGKFRLQIRLEHPRCRSPRDLMAEGEALLAYRPGCEKLQNELYAVSLILGLHARGFDVSLDGLEGCIQRMRITVETGVYPEDLLQRAGSLRLPRNS